MKDLASFTKGNKKQSSDFHCSVFCLSTTTKLDNLISQNGCILVLHHAGRFFHLLFQAGNFLFLFCLCHLHAAATFPLCSRRRDFNQITDRLNNRLGNNTMRLILCILDLTATTGFFDCRIHGCGYMVCIHDNAAFRIAGSTTDGLNKACLRSQKTFLICV